MKYYASVIVVSRNSEDTIRQCLSSLVEQDFNMPFEIIVVDSSSDRTPEIIRNEFPEVKLKHFRKIILPGRARNIGVKASSGEVILFLPADCYSPKNWLSKKLQHHAKGFSVVASSIDNGNPHRILGWVEFFAEYSRQMFSSSEKPQIVTSKGLLFLSYARKIFEELGPYSKEFFGNEDTLFVTKIVKNQIPTYYDPGIWFFHINNSSIYKHFRHQFVHGKDAGTVARDCNMVDSDYKFKFILPLYFPLVKWMVICFRVVKKRHHYLAAFLLLSPLIVTSLFIYSIGYIYGYYFRKA